MDDKEKETQKDDEYTLKRFLWDVGVGLTVTMIAEAVKAILF